MNNEISINRFLEGRNFNVVATIAFVAAAVMYVLMGRDSVATDDGGWCLPSCNLWVEGRWQSMLLNVACVVASGYMLKHLNRLHGFIRANASIALSAFFMLQLATPSAGSLFGEGTLMVAVVMLLAYMLLNTYHQRLSQRVVFLTFVLLGFYVMLQFMAIYLVVVLFVGFIQMQVMNLRGFMAMLFGLFTPYWILYGFGVIDFSDFVVPDLQFLWNDADVSWVVVGTCVVTAFATLVLMMSNAVRIISYNAKRRACNGFFSMLTICTIIVMVVDSANIEIYLPTLNMCLGVQVGHAFTISNNDKRYVPVFVLCALCVGLFVYNIWF